MRTEKVANTINWLTKTARKRPKIGLPASAKDNVTTLNPFYIKRTEKSVLTCLTACKTPLFMGFLRNHG